MTELATLLKQHGLEQYHHKLLEEGYDIDAVKQYGLTESDLDVIGVTKLAHKKKMMAMISSIRTSAEGNAKGAILRAIGNEMPSCLNYETCWEMLNFTKESVPEMESLVWKYIVNKAEIVIQSLPFRSISEQNLITFLQNDELRVDEFTLLLAVANWIENNPKCSSVDIAEHIRFGLLTKDQLVKAEKFLWVRPEMLYFAWRKLAAPSLSMIDLDVPQSYFTARFECEIMSASKYPYTPTTSSNYSGFSTPTYESLTNEEYNLPGAATNYEASPWLQATFPVPVRANTLIVGAPNGGLYTSQGWNSPTYTDGMQLQVSADGSEWRTILTTENSKATGPSEYTFDTETSRYWRLFKSNCYIATGTFILK